MKDDGNINSEDALKPESAYPAWVRRLWRGLLRIRFRLLQNQRYNKLVIEKVAGYYMVVLPQVFNPVLLRTGEFLARSLNAELIPKGADVLDMGCGSGIGSVAAALWADHVTAADINPEAVRCARINAALNRIEDRFEAVESNLFSSLKGRRFDVVLFNPPFFRGEAKDLLDHAWRAQDTLERFARELPEHLTPGGRALVVFSSDGDVDGLLAAFRDSRCHVEILEYKDLVNEIFLLYHVMPQDRRSQ